MSRTLRVFFANIVLPAGIAYTVTELLDHMRGPLLRPKLFCTSVVPPFTRPYHSPVFNPLVWRMLCKARVPGALQNRVTLRIAARSIRANDVVYLWPPYDTALIRLARDRGASVIAERINCTGRACKVVLDRAFSRIGRALPPGWCNPEDMENEEEQLRLCDFVTAPNAFVTQSLLDAGIAPKRILETSYGWSLSRLQAAVAFDRPARPPVFLFVGLGNVRKGLDLLLEAWERSGVQGTLHLAGRIDDELRARCARQLARPDVKELGHISDMASVYADADVFVFPSHEEGGPQVTYEAAGCGLPCIVSPMGAGRIIRHREEGFVIDPFDTNAWGDAMRSMADDVGRRHQLGLAAAQRAQYFTWDKVGARLYELFVTRV